MTIREVFAKAFGSKDNIVVGRAPGRVNLIGEHTDYNDGFVFPMAIEFAMDMAARRRSDGLVRIYAGDLDSQVEFSLEQPLLPTTEKSWANYPLGVLSELQKVGISIPGLEIAFSGDVPQGSGLSSSAALEVVTGVVLRELIGFQMDGPQLAKVCQRAENNFVGMQCGIMDQFISMMGQKDHGLFLDCRSLAFKQVPLRLGEYSFVVCHSGVRHSLVDSKYNVRRAQCEQGVEIIRKRFGGDIAALRDVSSGQLEQCRGDMSKVVYNRCKHVIDENQRVLISLERLEKDDLVSFGQLMNASHYSLRDLYEVSCQELDLLVDLARELPGVLGSRMTGGGFGGCTVSLVSKAAVELFCEQVVTQYKGETGIDAQVYVTQASQGAHLIRGGNES